jgi:putative transposase
MNPELVNNEHSVGQNCFHFTWTPKYRYTVTRSENMKQLIAKAIINAAQRHSIKIIELRVLDDHIHCFVHLPPTISVSSCIQLLKGSSSHLVRKWNSSWMKKYKALRSRGYFYRSVGAVTGAVVENYIKNSQGKHAYWKQTTLAEG